MVNIADSNRIVTRLRKLRGDRDALYRQINALDKRYVAEFNSLTRAGQASAVVQLTTAHIDRVSPLETKARVMDRQIERAERDLSQVVHSRSR